MLNDQFVIVAYYWADLIIVKYSIASCCFLYKPMSMLMLSVTSAVKVINKPCMLITMSISIYMTTLFAGYMMECIRYHNVKATLGFVLLFLKHYMEDWHM